MTSITVKARDSFWNISLVLTASAGFNALGNFLYWAIEVRRGENSVIGIALGLNSMVNLITVFSAFGLAESIIRESPVGRRKPLSGLAFQAFIGSLVAAAVSIIYSSLGGRAPSLGDTLVFIVVVLGNLTYVVSTSSYMAARKLGDLFWIALLVAVAKLILAIVCPTNSLFWILAPYGAVVLLTSSISLFGIRKHRNPKQIEMVPVRRHHSLVLGRYRFVNWVGSVFSLVPVAAVLFVVNRLEGPFSVASYSIPFTLMSGMALPAAALGNAFFIRSAAAFSQGKTLKPSWNLLAPAAAIVGLCLAGLMLASVVHSAIGKNLFPESLVLTKWLLVATIFMIPNYLIDARLNSNGNYFGFLVTNVLGSSSLAALGVVAICLNPLMLGPAWVAGQMIYSFVGLLCLSRWKN